MMTIKGGTSQACAACKYQRRKCAPNCALAPYFPADKPKTFQNAHRLFGVCNIMKILKQLSDDQKDEAMQSIIFESDMRKKFPVLGCSYIIYNLNEQLKQAQKELHDVNSWLAMLQAKEQHCHGPGGPVIPLHFLPGPAGPANVDHMYNKDDVVGFVEDVKPFWLQQQQHGNSSSNYVNSEVKQSMIQQGSNYYVNSEVKRSMIPQGLFMPFQQEIDEVSHDYDDDDNDMPFDTIADDRQSYVESKDACESRYANTSSVSKKKNANTYF